ncbi:YibE/F family protein [Nocardioides sp. SR21]|uniref:YibE/F family protein n=1 Tax=Nocardioides sp. SR21 TaxID=2919501 RepID=UPI001FAA34BA|nr:YibE/F family protein [Nocardioides sp. SR21]
MGAGHSHGSHRAGRGDDVVVPRGPRTVLLGALGLSLLATLIGLLLLWPDGDEVAEVADRVNFAAPGVTFPTATVEEVQPACDGPGSMQEDCGNVVVTVDEGAGKGDPATVSVPPEVSTSGLAAGDTIKLLRSPGAEGADPSYSYFGTVRSGTLLLLFVAFVVLVLVVARWRGLFALFGLAFSGLVIWKFMLPALVTGSSGLAVGLVGSAAIMFVVLYTTHGFSVRTSAALAGTLAGVVLTAGIGVLATSAGRVTGIADEGGALLSSIAGDLDFQSLFACAIVVAGLGVLNDVTITQASSVWEIRAAAPTAGRLEVFASGMRIGRDHIASTIYTIVFAYAGTALTVLMLLQLYGLPVADLLSTEEITQELVRTMASSIGLVLAVPLTTGIATLVMPGPSHS